eukprot:2942762-Pleurochrysis_carterae.AAC.2
MALDHDRPFAWQSAPTSALSTRELSSKGLCSASFNSITASHTFDADFKLPALHSLPTIRM